MDPVYSSQGAACFDLHAIHDVRIYPHQQASIRTGLSVEIPAGHALMVYSRSGHAMRNRVSLGNSVGVIDSDYRGEIIVMVRNDGPDVFDVTYGMRIAQGMVIACPAVQFVEADLSSTERGENGFGSTG